MCIVNGTTRHKAKVMSQLCSAFIFKVQQAMVSKRRQIVCKLMGK